MEVVRRAEVAEEVARSVVSPEQDGTRLSPGVWPSCAAAGPGGPAVLGAALRRLATARASNDRTGRHAALGEAAAAAVAWRDRL